MNIMLKSHKSSTMSKLTRKYSLTTTFAALALLAVTAAQATVTVTNVTVAQRPWTKLVDIGYDVASTATNRVAVSLVVSNGAAAVSATTLSGDIGSGVATGTGKAIVWNIAADWNGNVAAGVRFCVTADDGAAVPPVVPEGMVLVQGGSLTNIGNGAITVASFCIGKYEVTWAEWQTVRTWAATNGYDIGSVGAGSATNHPVRDVSWFDVVKWCNARSQKEGRTPVYTVGGAIYKSGENSAVVVNASANGYRLPTDAEWEFAARGGTQSQGYTYSGGNDMNAVGWYSDNSSGAAVVLWSGRGTWPVGMKAANELGLYDMSGNVNEWCFDWFPGYEGSDRVLRGGSWYLSAIGCRAANLNFFYPPASDYGIGFRPVLPPGQ